MAKKTYSNEFKQEIAEKRIVDGRTIQSLVDEYQISKNVIYKWTQEYREECQKKQLENDGKTKLDLMEEIRVLKQEKAEAEKEIAFLKKAAAFFAKAID